MAIALDKARKYAKGGSVTAPAKPAKRNIIPEGFSPQRIEEYLMPPHERDWPAPTPEQHEYARRADGGDVPELVGLSPIDRLRFRQDAENARQPSASEIEENRLGNIEELAAMAPVTGNAMAASDAYQSARDAVAALRRGRYRDAAIEGGLAAVSGAGAVSPLPWGRAAGRAARDAGRTAAVLIPAAEGAGGTKVAHDMRMSGVEPDRIWRETRHVVSPDGSIRREIPDTGLELKRNFKPGDVVPAGEAIRHPKLFGKMPELAGRPVYFTDDIDRMGKPVVRNTDSGAMVVNPSTPNVRAAMAKLLQYDINREAGYAAPLRHGERAVEAGLNSAVTRADALEKLPEGDRRMVDAYLDHIADARDNYDMIKEISGYQKRGPLSAAAERLSSKNAGNLEAKIAALRSGAGEADMTQWPYRRTASYLKGGQLPKWGNTLVLPPEQMVGDELLDFIRRWGARGAGRGTYASGGRVKQTVGAMRGDTPGRSDKLPIDVPAGSYVIPADVIAALGQGNSEAGMAELERRLGRQKRANGGKSVPILISHGEFVVDPERVAQLGGPDVLDQFVKQTRNAYVNHLRSIPDPNT